MHFINAIYISCITFFYSSLAKPILQTQPSVTSETPIEGKEPFLEHAPKPKCFVGEEINGPQQDTRKSDPRHKRFAINNSKWHTTKLKWKIVKYSNKLSNEDVEKVFDASFKLWEIDTNLQFEKVTDNEPSHIRISFFTGAHGDTQNFDGAGNDLAHAFFPEDGQIHIDDDEPWAPPTSFGRDLYPVAAHEIGHTLGLRHSIVRNALMYAEYKGKNEALTLDQDDLEAVQVLYGSIKAEKKENTPDSSNNDKDSTNVKIKKSMIPPILIVQRHVSSSILELTSKSTEYITPTSVSITDSTTKPVIQSSTLTKQPYHHSFIITEDICADPKLDVFLVLDNGTAYAFKGNLYWRLGPNGAEAGYPRNIENDWGVPGHLDAAYTDSNGDTYFFKGEKYWVFNKLGHLGEGYPKSISSDFVQTPNNLDGVIKWDGKLYFFKGKRYWPYTEDNSVQDWPKYINEISPILTSKIDAAGTNTDGNSYLFSGHVYYKIEVVNGELKIASGYPKKTGPRFFGCSTS